VTPPTVYVTLPASVVGLRAGGAANWWEETFKDEAKRMQAQGILPNAMCWEAYHCRVLGKLASDMVAKHGPATELSISSEHYKLLYMYEEAR